MRLNVMIFRANGERRNEKKTAALTARADILINRAARGDEIIAQHHITVSLWCHVLHRHPLGPALLGYYSSLYL